MEENKVIYRVEVSKTAKKELDKIAQPYAENILSEIIKLVENPRPSNSKKLKGTTNLYRLRVSMYRIIYTIEDEILRIEVIKIGHRREVYRKK